MALWGFKEAVMAGHADETDSFLEEHYKHNMNIIHLLYDELMKDVDPRLHVSEDEPSCVVVVLTIVMMLMKYIASSITAVGSPAC